MPKTELNWAKKWHEGTIACCFFYGNVYVNINTFGLNRTLQNNIDQNGAFIRIYEKGKFMIKTVLLCCFGAFCKL